ncbi:MAG: alginate export family protein [Deltaproteobacteria bacterium]|nr:alginate export family protein [Deltaproteobacteria bacterium]
MPSSGLRHPIRGLVPALLAFAGASSPARAEPPHCQRPSYELLRYDEDYSFLADPTCRTDLWDRAKYLPLGASRTAYFSFGADLRERYEYLHSPDWGRDPQDPSGYFLHRLMLHGDLHLGSHFRGFVQLKSALLGDRTGGARPTDEDVLDLHQAFVDAIVGPGRMGTLTLRGGRQELAYGSSRLISVREGPNVRRSFDGLRVMHRLGTWQTDVLAFAPVETNPGIFDDGRERGQWLWGVYGAGPLLSRNLGIDVYYLGVRRPDAAFDQGTALELRHSLGTRVWGEPGDFDYNVELVYQWGRFGDGNISAWTVASDTGYTAKPWPTRPRFGLKADVTSGDTDPSDRNLQTFNPLFPRGNYFGEASLVGPRNHIDIQPSIDIHPVDALTITAAWMFFWRQSDADGLYRVSGAPQVTAGSNLDRYVGSQGALTVEWEVERHLTFVGTYSHFFPGGFLQQSGVGKHVDFVGLWAACRL